VSALAAGAELRPAGQPMHSVSPDDPGMAYVPLEHVTQILLASKYFPPTQGLHTVVLPDAVVERAGHCKHTVNPNEGAYLPGAHSVDVGVPIVHWCPFLHLTAKTSGIALPPSSV